MIDAAHGTATMHTLLQLRPNPNALLLDFHEPAKHVLARAADQRCTRDRRAGRDGRVDTGSAAPMWDSVRPTVLGLAVGAGAALLASCVVVAAMFFGVSPQDPIAYGAAVTILLAAAILAVLVPTRRAAAVDAACVLRRW